MLKASEDDDDDRTRESGRAPRGGGGEGGGGRERDPAVDSRVGCSGVAVFLFVHAGGHRLSFLPILIIFIQLIGIDIIIGIRL